MEQQTESYIILRLSSAVKAVALLGWLISMLDGWGASWSRHARDMRVIKLELEKAVDMSKRATERASRSNVA